MNTVGNFAYSVPVAAAAAVVVVVVVVAVVSAAYTEPVSSRDDTFHHSVDIARNHGDHYWTSYDRGRDCFAVVDVPIQHDPTQDERGSRSKTETTRGEER